MADKKAQSRSSISMHEGIAVWCDCCSCEIEPYWQAVADELGIDLGSDYESNNVPDKPESIPGDSGS
ncbi:hypothetical protein [Thiohalophilus thiocyanatoxydans]|uniref:Uncharacterized protein n=1 Tax=Thiohalophilus thiocyanatoxydans TaxID=381308 RepID=A0A4R8IUK2_9GAMM|nr:hypothetical protein [Thiohalophilus thiocyanatoxydans]TDY04104.1 hypothetical protein EDC23_0476 [Thiohalophilus thiocyanatoxydans]